MVAFNKFLIALFMFVAILNFLTGEFEKATYGMTWVIVLMLMMEREPRK